MRELPMAEDPAKCGPDECGPDGCGPEACGTAGTGDLDPATAADLATKLKLLADPVRLRLLNLLATAPEGEVCACDFVEPLGRSQPTVSHHLKVLREAGLIDGERRGTWIWYSLRREAIADVLDTLRAAAGLEALSPV